MCITNLLTLSVVFLMPGKEQTMLNFYYLVLRYSGVMCT